MIVERREGESQDQLLSRFRTLVQRTGILREIKKRRHFISKSEARRMAQARAARRARKRAKTTPTR
ncbi:MAG: 30S ribosomal protein S21 [Dehalococcoidia bacterium]